MLRRGIIIAAVAVYLIILIGCVFQSSSTADTGNNNLRLNLPDEKAIPYKGVAMQIQRVDLIDRYKEGIDEMVKFGVDTVLLIVDARQENGSSTQIYIDQRIVPSRADLGSLFDHAKKRGLRVAFMPIVLLDRPKSDDEWRGTINPDSWHEWFNCYRNMLVQFADVAQASKIDIFVVGSELVSTERQAKEWSDTISTVRDHFKGRLTYSSNWDHYWDIPFWDQLDMIGMNSYWALGDSRKATVPEIVAHWKKIQTDLKAFVDKKQKRLFFTEVGWCALANAATEPWDYTKTNEEQDVDLQKRLWQAFFESWHGTDWLAGFTIWAWQPGEYPPDDKGYCPKGKPSYDLIKGWLAKPWK